MKMEKKSARDVDSYAREIGRDTTKGILLS